MAEEGQPQLTDQEEQPKRKLAFIDGLRGIAALYVVIGHLCVMVDPNIRINKPTTMDVDMYKDPLGPENELLYMMAVCLPIILIASYLFYRLFERPFMTARRRRAEAIEESQILQGQHQVAARPASVSAPAYATKSAYGLGRRRRRT